MAKKKSKVAKQKQKKAKSLTKKRKQISSKYNLPLHSSGSLKKAATNIKTPYNSPKALNKPDSNDANPACEKRRMKRAFKVEHDVAAVAARCNSNEQKDFMEEFKSLQERTLRQHQKQKENKQYERSAAISFNQPIFDINKKATTEELIIQATNQFNEQQFMNTSGSTGSAATTTAMFESLNDANNLQNTSNCNKNRNLLQEMAAKKREEMRIKTLYCNNTSNTNNGWNVQSTNDHDKMKENSFWALQEDDSDEENGNNACKGSSSTTTSGGNLFSFSAPSFIVPSTTHSQGTNNGLNHDVAEDDPDL